MQSEFLDSCHLCGHPMGSNAPVCPKCFARSDPAARDQIRARQALAWVKQRESDEEHQAFVARARRNLLMLVIAVAVIVVAAAVSVMSLS